MDIFAPYSSNPLCFIVENITTNPKKTIRIFQSPINWNCTRDLMRIEGVAEGDIRASLLKGELRNRLINKEITVLCSDIDLLQFNDANLAFLIEAGITNGLKVSGAGGVDYLIKQGQYLIGALDGQNRVFNTSDKFINAVFEDNDFTIDIFHNGRRLAAGLDFNASESNGTGTGFDTVTLTFTPAPTSILRANYYTQII